MCGTVAAASSGVWQQAELRSFPGTEGFHGSWSSLRLPIEVILQAIELHVSRGCMSASMATPNQRVALRLKHWNVM